MFVRSRERSTKAVSTMKTIHLIALAATLAAVPACNHNVPASENSGASQQAAQIYSGSGTLRSISGDQVAIAHGPIAGIGWPAMTMTFTAPPGMTNGVKAGAKVAFSFRANGSTYVLTSLTSS